MKLKAYFAPPTMSQSDLARALGVTPQAVSNWVNGVARPGAAQREAIQRITGIDADAWFLKEEQAGIDKAVKRAAGAR